MLTTNVDVSHCLVNGARGEMVCIATNSDNKVTHVVVKFDNAAVGAKARHASNFLSYSDAGSEVTCLQFLLTLAWATTIHKVRGLARDDIVVENERWPI